MPRARLLWSVGLLIYVLLLAASHLLIALQPASPPPSGSVMLPVMTAEGALDDQRAHVHVERWASDGDALPIMLLHGSPGAGSNFTELAQALTRAGHEVLAPDLPGFGSSQRDLPDLGPKAQARVMLELLRAENIERAHVVGWSNGGAVGLWMADLEPGSIASLTLLASVGVMEAEGSGSYWFEQGKYRLGLALHAGLRWLTPHFGLLSPDDIAWLRNFADTDLRPMRDLMQAVRTPTLILHGRHDFLTPAWGAELHHGLMRESRLVMLDANHFIPFMQADEAAGFIIEHADRHEDPWRAARTDVVDLAPSATDAAAARMVRAPPWWVLVVLIALFTARWPEVAAGVVTACVYWLWIDVGVALLGMFIGVLELHGRCTKPAPSAQALWIRRGVRTPLRTALMLRFMPWQRREGLVGGRIGAAPGLRWALGSVLGTGIWLVVTQIAGVVALVFTERWLANAVPDLVLHLSMVLAAVLGAKLIVQVLTHRGRQRLWMKLRRVWTHEFWPSWAYYLPISPWLGALALRHGAMTWTCANPGMPMGGGVIGESKGLVQQTLEGTAGSASFEAGLGGALPARTIEAGPTAEQRARHISDLVEQDAALGGWPVILKPDSGFRGYGVRLVRDQGQAERYCRAMPRRLVVQRYHPGPAEFGVLWHRKRDGSGAIFGITAKTLPTVAADGVRTRESLVMADRRLVLQADVLLARLGTTRDAIDEEGTVISLGSAGNHAQGCRFDDASDLASPALCAALTSFAGKFAGGMDFGRFDLRCADRDSLQAARGLSVIEANGTTSEATHMYAPDMPLLWRYRTMVRLWRVLFELGAARRAEGVEPVGLGAIALGLWRHYRGRPSEGAIG